MPFDQGHALIVGVGTYEESGWDAPVTVGDARELTTALTDPEVAGYLVTNVNVLQDNGATRANVIQALDDLGARATKSDTVLLFFAGHGVMGEDEQYYLTTHDSRFTPTGYVVQDTGVSETTLLEKLRAVHANKVLVIINACFSGKVRATLGVMPAGARLGTPPAEELLIGVLSSGEGRAVMAACRASQSSWFDRSDPRNTVFGKAVVDGFRGRGERGSTPYIKLYELYDYVFSAVVEGAKHLGGVQEPVLNIVEGVGPFPVALRADIARLGPPNEKEDSSAPEQRPEGAADGPGQAFEVEPEPPDDAFESPPPTADVIDRERLRRFRYATQPLDEGEDVLGVFYGNQKQVGGQLIVTNRRILIGPIALPLARQIESYATKEGSSSDFVAAVLHRYYKTRPDSIDLTDVTGVEPTKRGLVTAPTLTIRRTTGEPVRFAVVATPTSIIWDRRNRPARDKALETIRVAMSQAKAAAAQSGSGQVKP